MASHWERCVAGSPSHAVLRLPQTFHIHTEMEAAAARAAAAGHRRRRERTMYSRLWQSSSSSRCSPFLSALPRGRPCHLLNLACTPRSCVGAKAGRRGGGGFGGGRRRRVGAGAQTSGGWAHRLRHLVLDDVVGVPPRHFRLEAASEASEGGREGWNGAGKSLLTTRRGGEQRNGTWRRQRKKLGLE